MRRLLALFLLCFTLFQAAATSAQGMVFGQGQGQELAHTVMHWEGTAHHHDDEGGVHQDDSDESAEHILADDAMLYTRYASRSDPSSARGLRTAEAKLVATWHPASGLEVRFFDLVDDPFELTSRPSDPRTAALSARLLSELDEAADGWEGAAALAAYPAQVTG